MFQNHKYQIRNATNYLEPDKHRQLAEVDSTLGNIKLRRAEVNNDIKDEEQVVDSALLFMSSPAQFWNLA